MIRAQSFALSVTYLSKSLLTSLTSQVKIRLVAARNHGRLIERHLCTATHQCFTEKMLDCRPLVRYGYY